MTPAQFRALQAARKPEPFPKPPADDRKPILCLDFDGVLHSYVSGWQGADVVCDPPTDGAMVWLSRAVRHFDVAICSSRSHQPNGILAMQLWLKLALARACEDQHEAAHVYGLIRWPTHKPAAMVTIDNRALTFTGNWSDFDVVTLRQFQPWNKRA